MPNVLDENGLQIQTLQEVTDQLIAKFREIYGNDILLDSNTPDGQLLNIFAQNVENTLEEIQGIYNQFDLYSAVGVQLDQRAALIGVTRGGATYTLVYVDVETSRATRLEGLDAAYADPQAAAYGVQDINGNVYYLVSSTDLSAGTTSLLFRAKNLGPVELAPAAITQQESVNPDVISVINPAAPVAIGVEEESDGVFRTRILRSRAISAQSVVDALYARLNEIEGVISARVYENRTPYTDADGIPPHSIWTIVRYPVSDSLNEQIAQAIYSTISMTSGQKQGSQSYTITSMQGMACELTWDNAVPSALGISLTIQKLVTGATSDESAIKKSVAANLLFEAGQPATSAQAIYAATNALNTSGGAENGFIAGALLSSGSSVNVTYLRAPNKSTYFLVGESDVTISYLEP